MGPSMQTVRGSCLRKYALDWICRREEDSKEAKSRWRRTRENKRSDQLGITPYYFLHISLLDSYFPCKTLICKPLGMLSFRSSLTVLVSCSGSHNCALISVFSQFPPQGSIPLSSHLVPMHVLHVFVPFR